MLDLCGLKGRFVVYYGLLNGLCYVFCLNLRLAYFPARFTPYGIAQSSVEGYNTHGKRLTALRASYLSKTLFCAFLVHI